MEQKKELKKEKPLKTFLIAVIIIGVCLVGNRYIGGGFAPIFDIGLLIGLLFVIIGVVQAVKNIRNK